MTRNVDIRFSWRRSMSVLISGYMMGSPTRDSAQCATSSASVYLAGTTPGTPGISFNTTGSYERCVSLWQGHTSYLCIYTDFFYGLVINYREGGYKMRKSWVQYLLCPQPPKTIRAPHFKGWTFFAPPYFRMVKTSSSRVKTTPKLCVPPLQDG